MADLGTLGGTESYAYAINNSGQVAGWAFIADNAAAHATRFEPDGTKTDLATAVGTFSFATAINNTGKVAGYGYSNNVAAPRALFYNGTTSGTLFPNPGYTPLGINDLDQVVGEGPFLWSNNHLTTLPSLLGNFAAAEDINDSGAIVGYSTTYLNQAIHATYYKNGLFKDLNDVIDPVDNWVVEFAFSINDSGLIVGSGRIGGPSGLQHALLLTPVPEPSGACGMAALLLLWVRTQRRNARNRL